MSGWGGGGNYSWGRTFTCQGTTSKPRFLKNKTSRAQGGTGVKQLYRQKALISIRKESEGLRTSILIHVPEAQSWQFMLASQSIWDWRLDWVVYKEWKASLFSPLDTVFRVPYLPLSSSKWEEIKLLSFGFIQRNQTHDPQMKNGFLTALYYKHINIRHYRLLHSCNCPILTIFPFYSITSGLVSSIGYLWFRQEANIRAVLNSNSN